MCIDTTTMKEFYYVVPCLFGFVCWFLYSHFFECDSLEVPKPRLLFSKISGLVA